MNNDLISRADLVDGSDDIDTRSYMLGYLKGCEDSLKMFNELNKPQFSMPLRKKYMKGGAE